ncbi:MAG: LysM peptidoglycan-binding domain-containing protein, partial [Myxococcota bacterium]
GASWKGAYILTRNGLSDDALPAGKRVVIPASWTYSAKRGDSYASIAKRMVGDADRYRAILRFNRLSERKELSVGQELLMPFHLRHSVTSGESLSQISRRYYRTTKLASMLKEYNGLEKANLDVGQKLTVPIFDRNTLKVGSIGDPDTVATPEAPFAAAPDAPESPDAETGAAVEEEPSAPEAPEVAETVETAAPRPTVPPSKPTQTPAAPSSLELKTVDAALEAYNRGYFLAGCSALEKQLEGRGLEPRQRSRVIQYLGFCGVARGEDQAARDYFRSWLLTDPEATLDRRLTSPKILEIFDEVADEVRR